MTVWTFDSPAQASAGMRELAQALSEFFEYHEVQHLVGEEGYFLWHSIEQPTERTADASYALFRVGPVIARSRWGDFADLPNFEDALAGPADGSENPCPLSVAGGRNRQQPA
jgi:hypothetical protein